jgi:hypothetical protein
LNSAEIYKLLDGQAVNSLEVEAFDSTGIAVNCMGTPSSVVGESPPRFQDKDALAHFTVKYRVVGDDGHVIEGECTFNASPDYSEGQSPMPISAEPQKLNFQLERSF